MPQDSQVMGVFTEIQEVRIVSWSLSVFSKALLRGLHHRAPGAQGGSNYGLGPLHPQQVLVSGFKRRTCTLAETGKEERLSQLLH